MRLRGFRAAALVFALATVGSFATRALAQTPSKLAHAISLFDRGDDEAARKEFQKLTTKPLPSADAARVHIYLGLLKLNALDTNGARAELTKAVQIDATIELPVDASPKAGLVFKQARAVADRDAALPPAAAPAPPQPAPPAPPPEQVQTPLVVLDHTPDEAAPGPSHTVSLIVGGLGLAGAITGGVFLGLSASSLSSARGAGDVGTSQSDAKQSANQQYLAEWFLSAGGGVFGAAVVVFIVESVAGGKPSVDVASHAMTVAAEGLHF
jgi:hypothetical protein